MRPGQAMGGRSGRVSALRATRGRSVPASHLPASCWGHVVPADLCRLSAGSPASHQGPEPRCCVLGGHTRYIRGAGPHTPALPPEKHARLRLSPCHPQDRPPHGAAPQSWASPGPLCSGRVSSPLHPRASGDPRPQLACHTRPLPRWLILVVSEGVCGVNSETCRLSCV